VIFPLRKWPHDFPLPYNATTDDIVAFCAEEVRRQGDTPWHVYMMYNAWIFAMDIHVLTHNSIRAIGSMIDEANDDGYRNGSVWVGGEEKMGHSAIHAAMTDWLEHQDKLTPIELYKWFEDIHPFFDGNGRTGKVLYNWLKGTLHSPVWPEDLYGGIENP
jgi:hypothetical protein